jgi:hypothetical protein
MLRATIATACLTFGTVLSAQDVPTIVGTRPDNWRLSLPVTYQAELDRVAPGISIFTNRRYTEYPPVVDSASSPSVLIRDLNGDHRPEVFLAGFAGDSVVVVALITSPTGVVGQVLLRRPRESYEEHGVDEILNTAKDHGRTWIRWQDDDCKGQGWEFRLIGTTFRRRKSKCSYGE